MTNIVKSESDIGLISSIASNIIKEGDQWIKLTTIVNREIIGDRLIEKDKCYYQMYDGNYNNYVDLKKNELTNKLGLESIKELFEDNKIKSIKVLYIFIVVSKDFNTINEEKLNDLLKISERVEFIMIIDSYKVETDFCSGISEYYLEGKNKHQIIVFSTYLNFDKCPESFGNYYQNINKIKN